MEDDRVVDWKGLKALGWPYSRTHTQRLEDAGKFPKRFKLVDARSAHPMWLRRLVLEVLRPTSPNT